MAKFKSIHLACSIPSMPHTLPLQASRHSLATLFPPPFWFKDSAFVGVISVLLVRDHNRFQHPSDCSHILATIPATTMDDTSGSRSSASGRSHLSAADTVLRYIPTKPRV